NAKTKPSENLAPWICCENNYDYGCGIQGVGRRILKVGRRSQDGKRARQYTSKLRRLGFNRRYGVNAFPQSRHLPPNTSGCCRHFENGAARELRSSEDAFRPIWPAAKIRGKNEARAP